jgi:hypothetical protein
MTFEDVQELIAKSKKLVADDGHQLNSYYLEQSVPLNVVLNLTDTETEKLKFRIDVTQSPKVGYKISFHMMDANGYIGLSRLDVNGLAHTNPKEVTDKVPDFLKSHASERINTSHLHYYVEDYETLAWALPLADVDNENMKDISTTTTNLSVDIVNALAGFLSYIHVETKITVNPALL